MTGPAWRCMVAGCHIFEAWQAAASSRIAHQLADAHYDRTHAPPPLDT